MRAFIHTADGHSLSEECAIARRGFQKLGVECVLFSDEDALKGARCEDVVVGDPHVMDRAFSLIGVVPPAVDCPASFSRFLGREVRVLPVGDIKSNDLPLFVKPLEGEEPSGAVVKRPQDLARYAPCGRDRRVLCSEPVEVVSAWRFFFRYGSFADACHYRAEARAKFDVGVMNEILAACADDPQVPAGCAVDIGATADGRTLLVGLSDGYALASCGADSVAYALLLAARWAELVGVKDELAELDNKGFRKEHESARLDTRLLDLLDGIPGSTDSFASLAFQAAEWMGAERDLVDMLEREAHDAASVWRWIAERQGLATQLGPGGGRYLFPRLKRMRVAVRAGDAEPLGSCSLKRYDTFSAVVLSYLFEPQPEEPLFTWLHSMLIERVECDAREAGLASVFALIGRTDSLPLEEFYSVRGYRRVPAKDIEDLARALGAYVTHDFVMEKAFA